MSPDDRIWLRHLADAAEQALAFMRGGQQLQPFGAAGNPPGTMNSEPQQD